MDWASKNGNKDIVGLLVRSGADVNAKNNVSTALILLFYIVSDIVSVIFISVCNDELLYDIVLISYLLSLSLLRNPIHGF